MISLIVATKGRVDEIALLFDSLIEQIAYGAIAPLRESARDESFAQKPAFEVILVDQNGDARLESLVARYAGRFALTHLRMARAHANAGRNLGLAHAKGDIVAFPDDDCVMPQGVLARVRLAFDSDGRLAVLTGPAAAPEGGLGSGRWNTERGPITLENVWTSVIEFNLWLRRGVALELGGFDENMGPGARFGSAEGNDLVCRALRAGYLARYAPELRVIHPDKRLSRAAAVRAGRYALGLGFALRRHGAPMKLRLSFLYRPLGGAVLALLKLNLLHAWYYLATFQGRLRGMLARPLPWPTPMEPAR